MKMTWKEFEKYI